MTSWRTSLSFCFGSAILVGGAFVFVPGCSSDDTPVEGASGTDGAVAATDGSGSTTVTDGSTEDVHVGFGNTSDAACNALSYDTTHFIKEIPADAGAMPMAAGGTIVDGTYQLTSVTQYITSGTDTLASQTDSSVTLEISNNGGTWNFAGQQQGGDSYSQTFLVEIKSATDTVTLTEFCPDDTASVVSYTYSASGNTFTYFTAPTQNANGSTTVLASTFTKE